MRHEIPAYTYDDNFKNTEGQKNSINQVGLKVSAERKKHILISHDRIQDNRKIAYRFLKM
jgi:hypothetical protein